MQYAQIQIFNSNSVNTAILGGLVFIGSNGKTEYTPSEEVRREHTADEWHWTDYPDKGK